MSLHIHPSSNVADRRRAAASFAAWLCRAEVEQLGEEPLRALIHRSAVRISWSSAYRVASRLGVTGHHHNRSRYDKFWAAINWRLPDGALERVWGCNRANLHKRRQRLAAGPPRWNLARHRHLPQFRRALAAEQRKEARFRGAVPR